MAYKIKVTKLPKSEVEIEAEIEESELEKARSKAISKLSGGAEMPGFRKGKVPEHIIVQKAGEQAILEEASEIAINDNLKGILEEAGKEAPLNIIGRPSVSILKLAFGNPLVFKLKVSVEPAFDLPDYKSIAAKVEAPKTDKKDLEPTEKEMEDVMLQIRKNKAHYDWHQANPKETDHSKHPDFDKEENLPVLDDEFAKFAGNFENIAALKDKVKENLIEDRRIKELEKRRAAIMEKLVKEVKVDLPDILVESETEKALGQIKDDLERSGMKFEEYLESIKKTEEDMRNDLQASSENKAKLQLIFNKIVEKEKLEPNKEILDNEVKKILEMYPEAKEESARIYVATMLLNSEVMKLLEK